MIFDEQLQHQRAKELIEFSNEDEILNRIVRGDKELYALIIRKYNQRLYRIALSIMNNESEVEDIMQVTYIKAYENLDKFRSHSSFSTWITRILINECLMNRKKREQMASNEWGFFFPADYQKPVVQTPLMKVINLELKAILEFSIRKLPEKYRTVFIMRELENMSVLETMECLGITETNVKVRLNRAKVMLRDKLKNYIKQDDLLTFYKPRCNRIVDHVMNKITSLPENENFYKL
jgi:RNA polymerase sigma factor (sigma-70 family)